MARLAIAVILPFFGLAGTCPLEAEPPARTYGPHTRVAVLDSGNVQESSGLVAGRRNPDVFWTHNDSPASGPRVWAMRLNASDRAERVARDLGYAELAGARNVDWEDISNGPDNTLYVFDGGDNPPCNRSDKRIYRFVEPVVDPAGARLALRVPAESIRFEYPHRGDPSAPAVDNVDRYDAECMMVHPVSGDIYVVTKRNTRDAGVARVYKLSADALQWNSPRIHVLNYVTDLTDVLGVSRNVVSTVTGGDIHASGRRLLIRRYGYAYEFTLVDDAGNFEAIFSGQPTSWELPGEVQGEAICYSHDGGDFYTTSEVRTLMGVTLGPARCPIYKSPGRPITTSPTGVVE